ncbi:MAG: SDR family oxidoreductase [Bryobacterales bacterium]|nr:SDR family oxidoreductase [Bryobacterales bacterium]
MQNIKMNILITGGGAGIGRDIVIALASAGHRIVSLDCNEAGNLETAALVRNTGGACEAVTGDVASSQDVSRAVETAGEVDVLVNNAAYSAGDGFLLDVVEDTWDRVLAVCLKGVYLCSRAVLAGMVARRSGVIINISSVNALAGIHLAAYTSAKGGINALTRLLAAQYGKYGIRANAICPGTILSESSREHYEAHPDIAADLAALYPAGKFGRTRDIAAAVLYLASDDASFINGAVIPIDGGLSAVRPIVSVVAKA